MGASSRPSDYSKNFTPEKSIDYFVEYLERWRVSMGDLKDFYLAGHSFGGYVVGNYAVKYHQHIRKLLLLSPIGIKAKDWVKPGLEEGEISMEQKLAAKGKRKPPKFIRSMAQCVFDKKISPFAAGRKLGRKVSKHFIKGFVERRQNIDNADHKQMMIDYQYQIFMRPPASEYALMVNFDA